MIPLGYVGIGDLDGVVHSFSKSHTVSTGDKDFKNVHKYVILDLDGVSKETYSNAIAAADDEFRSRNHSRLSCNSLSYVAHVLNNLNYNGHSNHSMSSVWWMCQWNSTYVTLKHFFAIHGLWLAILYHVLMLYIIHLCDKMD